MKEPNLVPEGYVNAGHSKARRDIQSIITVGTTLFNKTKDAREKARRKDSSPADVVLLSGCKDYKKAVDTVTSAVTLYFVS